MLLGDAAPDCNLQAETLSDQLKDLGGAQVKLFLQCMPRLEGGCAAQP